MCGLTPTLALLHAAPVSDPKGALGHHATSGEASGNHGAVAGNAGLVLE